MTIKTIIQAFLFSLLLHLCYMAFQIISGILITTRYKPNITAHLTSTYPESTIAFGVKNTTSPLTIVVTMVLGMVLFAAAKYVLVKVRKA
ncbi:hypothetical protein [Paenibacillus qinlingensis]|uniref:Uncharacterized protein n=1 Tax=Paenibacillus qinlingensis TaxID=1837343 RepID=A0ABU1NY48_9BACL|nr:hypothetical protein [Paenibacillus qinlingensis]MDR6552400.1 hypothetical protein [Paenibacillus qinlingensis]